MTEKKIVCSNRRAKYDYHIDDAYEAGMQLLGPEVKALRNNQISLAESWVKVNNQEAFLVGAHITCKAGGFEPVDPIRTRKLLLKKPQLRKLTEATTAGKTIIPLKVYFNERGLAKLEIAIVTGKKKFDKRQALKLKEFHRDKHDY